MARSVQTIDFRINAMLNGGFNSALQEARGKFLQLDEQIRGLYATQRDISSYQRQEQAIANTEQKLAGLERREEGARRTLEAMRQVQGETTQEQQRNAVEVAKLEERYSAYHDKTEQTRRKLEEMREAHSALGEKLREAGVDTADLGTATQGLTEKLQGLEAEQKKVDQELEEAAKKGSDFGQKAADAIDAAAMAMTESGLLEGLKQVGEAFLACVDAAGEFEYTMSAVEAIAGATGEEMEDLTEKAKETGLSTVYTAQQSGKAMEYMAMAGWKTNQMLSGMPGLVNLAAAAGEDLAEVSDIVTDNLTAFNMEADETGHFADVLAQTAANSNTNIAKLGESFKSSSAVAGSLGYSIEDVSVALGLMANRAVKSSRAGTALRNIFNGFVEGMTLTSDAFGEITVSAINADGSVKPFMETIRELRGYFSQMTGGEQIMNAKEIAGLRGYNGLLAILGATEEDFDRLYESVNNCTGAAERMAQVKLDNMRGDLILAQSAWEGMTIAIGEQFEPEARAALGLWKEISNGVSAFAQDHPAVVKALAGTAAAILGITAALGAAATAIKVVKLLDLGGILTGPVGIAIAATGAVAGLTMGLVELNRQANKDIPTVKELTKQTRAAAQAMEQAGDAYRDAGAEAEASAALAGRYIDRLEELEAAGEKSDDAASAYQRTLAALVETMPELRGQVEVNTDAYGRELYNVRGTNEALRDQVNAIQEAAKAQAMEEYWAELYKAQAKALLDKAKAENELEMKEAERATILTEIADLEAKQKETPMGQEYVERQSQLASLYFEEDRLTEEVKTYEQATQDATDVSEEAAKQLKVLERVSGELGLGLEDAAAGSEDLDAATADLVDPVRAANNALTELQTAYQKVYDEAYQSISGQYQLWDQVAERSAISAETVRQNLEGQAEYWNKYYDDLETLLGKADRVDGLAEMIGQGFSGGTEQEVNAIAGLADATDQELADTVAAWQRNNKAMEDAAQTMAQFNVDLRDEGEETAKIMEDTAQGILDSMDQETEAKLAALRTIRGYAQGLNQGLGTTGLFDNTIKMVDGMIARTGGYWHGSYFDIPGHTGGTGYAGGTGSAVPGWHVIGENGPEIVRLRGGEEVINATRTRSVLDRGGGDLNATVNVYVQGGGADTGRAVAREVRKALEELEADRRRRRYD